MNPTLWTNPTPKMRMHNVRELFAPTKAATMASAIINRSRQMLPFQVRLDAIFRELYKGAKAKNNGIYTITKIGNRKRPKTPAE